MGWNEEWWAQNKGKRNYTKVKPEQATGWTFLIGMLQYENHISLCKLGK